MLAWNGSTSDGGHCGDRQATKIERVRSTLLARRTGIAIIIGFARWVLNPLDAFKAIFDIILVVVHALPVGGVGFLAAERVLALACFTCGAAGAVVHCVALLVVSYAHQKELGVETKAPSVQHALRAVPAVSVVIAKRRRGRRECAGLAVWSGRSRGNGGRLRLRARKALPRRASVVAHTSVVVPAFILLLAQLVCGAPLFVVQLVAFIAVGDATRVVRVLPALDALVSRIAVGIFVALWHVEFVGAFKAFADVFLVVVHALPVGGVGFPAAERVLALALRA